MKIYQIAALSLALAGPAAAASSPVLKYLPAPSTPQLEFSAGGTTAALQLTSGSFGSWGVAPGTQLSLGDGLTFTLNRLTVDSDPYVFYSYSVQNTSSSPIMYTATIPAVPVSLTPGQYTVTSSLGITLTDGNPSSGVSIQPENLPGSIQQGLINGIDVGVDLGTTVVSNNSFLTTSTTNFSGGPIAYGLGSSASTISITESFLLSPGASVGLSGSFDVEPGATPEPSSVTLGLIAMGAFAVLLIRARRVRA